jgi:ribosomal-protein-alanine N-acetyltransferase
LTGRAPFVLRDLLAADLEEAWALDQRCFEPGIAYSRAEIRSFFARPGAVALAAERGGRLDGFAIAERRGVRGHVITIDVAEPARRRGVGRRLFHELFTRLEDAGAREIRLEVDVRNAGAIRFYESLGFDRTRVLRGYYGKGLDAYEMVRKG